MEPASTPRPLVPKKTLRDSLPIDMLLSVVSVLVVAQSSSEVPEGLVNNPVFEEHSTDMLGGLVPFCWLRVFCNIDIHWLYLEVYNSCK